MIIISLMESITRDWDSCHIKHPHGIFWFSLCYDITVLMRIFQMSWTLCLNYLWVFNLSNVRFCPIADLKLMSA